jgi:RimJ/RimL family protein N-acetyltransferase
VPGSLVIETPRLRLRPFREDDLDALTRFNADPAVARYLGSGKPMTRACSIIRPGNHASARVAQKLGARVDHRLDDFDGAATDVWLHAHSE